MSYVSLQTISVCDLTIVAYREREGDFNFLVMAIEGDF